MPDGAWIQNQIGAAGFVVIPVTHGPMPASYTLNSSDGSRKIEFSTNGGVSYFQPTYDVSTAAMLTAAATAPITHVQFTGAPTDMYSIA